MSADSEQTEGNNESGSFLSQTYSDFDEVTNNVSLNNAINQQPLDDEPAIADENTKESTLNLRSLIKAKDRLLNEKNDKLKSILTKLKDQELLEIDLKQKSLEVDGLRNQIEKSNELCESFERQRKQIDRLPEMERELYRAKQKYQELHFLIKNKLVLEEKTQDLELQLKMMTKDRDELIKYQTENIGLKSFFEDFKKFLAKVFDCSNFESISTIELKQKITEIIENSHSSKLDLIHENNELKSKVAQLEQNLELLKAEKKKSKLDIEDEKKSTQKIQNQLKIMQKKCNLLKMERDNYRNLVDAYEKDLTLANASFSTSNAADTTATAATTNRDELLAKITKLEESQRNYRILIEKYEQNTDENNAAAAAAAAADDDDGRQDCQLVNRGNELLRKQIDDLNCELNELRAQNEQFRTELAKREVKVFRLLENPSLEELRKADDEKMALHKEVDKLKQKIFQMQKSSNECNSTLSESIYIDSDKLTKENEQLKKKCERQYEIYQHALKEFRLILVKVFGYQLTKLTEYFRLQSCFDKPHEHHINFNLDANGNLHLLEGDYSIDVRNFLELQVARPQLLPIFISSLTVKLYRKQQSANAAATAAAATQSAATNRSQNPDGGSGTNRIGQSSAGSSSSNVIELD